MKYVRELRINSTNQIKGTQHLTGFENPIGSLLRL